MKTLICLWGQIRDDLNITINSIKKIIPEGEFDLLISTWDDQAFDESIFKYIIKSPSPSKEYLDSIKFPYTMQIKNVSEWHGVRTGHYAQFFHNYKIYQFLKSNSFDYDNLVQSRTDLVFDTDFIFNFNQDICYVPEIYWSSRGVGINDHFICGKYGYIKNSIAIENFEQFFHVIENSWNPETVRQRLIIGNNCRYTEFNCKSYLLLPDRKML